MEGGELHGESKGDEKRREKEGANEQERRELN